MTLVIQGTGFAKGIRDYYAEKVPLTNRALTGILPNGLTYYILENTFPENRAHLALIVNAGSVVEKDDERGFAHFVEHLAFNGTERFPEYELIDYLRSLGMRFGADANAYTSYDETVYHFDVPVETVNGVKRIPDRALAIIDDWTHAIKFNPEDVKDESLVVLEELRARLGAMERARKIILPILFQGSAYEDRDVIGLAPMLENATSRQLRAFYDRWYRSDNMAIAFVGDFDGKALEAELARHFNMPKASAPVNRPHYELPAPVNGNFNVQIITDPELTATFYDIYYKVKPISRKGTLDNYRESVIDNLIYTMLSLRFADAATDPQSATNGSWGGVWNWSANARFYSMETQPKTGNSEQALRELLLEKESMRRYGFTEGELTRAKISLVSSLERMLSEKDRMDSRNFITGFTGYFLYGKSMPDIEWELNTVTSMLDGIDLNEIAKASAAYFADNDISVFLLAPQAEAENLPSADRIRAIFREAESASISPRQDVSLSGDLLDSEPVSGSIISETKDEQTGAYIITLSNGAKVILKETANRNNEIVFFSTAKGGTANSTADTVTSVKLLSEMINFSGLGPYSRTELINKLTGKQVSFSYSNSDYHRGFQGSSTTQDLKTLFEMIHLFFTHPRLDERAIQAMIDQYRTYLAHYSDDPQTYLSLELNKLIHNNHPLFMHPEAADMDKVSIQQARAFLERCINPGDYTFIFTGNLDLETMRRLSAAYIASIPAGVSMNNWNDPAIPFPEGGRRTINKGMDERSIVYAAWFADAPSVFDEQKNQTSAVLSEYLGILLNDEIREKLGGVYSIYGGASVNTIPKGEYRIEVFFMCNPQRVDELFSAAQKNIFDIINQPVNMDIFNKAKEALLMGHERSIQQNLHIAQSYSNSFVLYDTPLNRLDTRPASIRSVTAEAMQALCREMLVNNPVQMILYPEGWNLGL